MLTSRPDVLIIDADSRAGLAIARSLGRRGLNVAAAGPTSSLALLSRYVQHRFTMPAANSAPITAYRESLLRLLERLRPAVVMCISDGSASALDAIRDQLPDDVIPALASPRAFAVAADKDATLAVANSLGIAVPTGRTASDPAEIRKVVGELGYPVVVKPTRSWRPSDDGLAGERVAGRLVREASELDSAIDVLVRPGYPMLTQEYATGARLEIALVRAAGRTWNAVAIETSRTWPLLGGDSVMRRTIPMPAELLERVEALLDAIDYEGFGHVEFRCDAAGEPLLTSAIQSE